MPTYFPGNAVLIKVFKYWTNTLVKIPQKRFEMHLLKDSIDIK